MQIELTDAELAILTVTTAFAGTVADRNIVPLHMLPLLQENSSDLFALNQRLSKICEDNSAELASVSDVAPARGKSE